MGMLINGTWIDDDAAHRHAADGAFVRPDANFTARVTADGSSGFKAEPGRYHLFVSAGCPWAHRTILTRRLKNLEDVISISFSDLPRVRSWAFSTGIGRNLEPKEGVLELHRVYTAAMPAYTGRVTVPTLWDKQRWTIVNNDSADIMRMLNTAFDEWGDRTVDLYPAHLRAEIDEINQRVYENVNNGVYRCGFARSQAAYEEAFARLFETLDWLDERLASSRYLCGERITEADWRLYVTLVRFDIAYYSNFKCNRQHLHEYPNLSNYLRELYQWPGIAQVTDFETIKRVYFSIKDVNPSGLIPIGPRDLRLTGPHDRGRLPSWA
ncbi:glutathione S-transferase family protein [Pantoea sp. 18069]|uniref:glutathione S-transferase family protein n=1 Tax=Pantoea sp. 18069 TaxID=2681415 RepID=UPI001358B9B1|nr:glutathione S-transferase family protein [Pantoea sp. 18069]